MSAKQNHGTLMLNYQASKIVVNHYKDDKKIDLNYPIFAIFLDNPSQQTWHKLPEGELLYQRWQQQKQHTHSNKPATSNIDADSLHVFESQLPNKIGTPICVMNLQKQNSTFKKLEKIKKQIVKLAQHKPKIINLILIDLNVDDEETIINHFIACTGSFYTLLPKISQKNDDDSNHDLNLLCHNVSQTYDHSRAIAEVHGNGLTRFLCNLPPNYLYPASYNEYVQKLAKSYNWNYEFLDLNTLKQKKAGAYLAVVQGSARQDAGIIKLSYKPKDLSNKKITLVGKGLCFDTGGYNLKTSPGSMYGMGHDMTGSAVALGTFLALTQLQVPFEIELWMALAQNDIGPEAYKPGDVVIASNGMSIEVINTDAEGRMVLCDTLHLASLEKPDLIFTFATLTGSCVRALDQLYSGFSTNRYQWNSVVTDIGQQCGERVWSFPYTDDYDEVLKSDIADIKQCHEGFADQIRAARFLGKFIHEDAPWIHIDLSSHAYKGGLGHIHSETSGFGVRLTLSTLLDSDIVL